MKVRFVITTTYKNGEPNIDVWKFDDFGKHQSSLDEIPAIAKPCDCCGENNGTTTNPNTVDVFSQTKYNSDAEAGAAGCQIGKYYITGNNHNEGLPEGIIKKRII